MKSESATAAGAPAASAAAAAPGRIRRLETRLINQIAAGEVVTRPAAALKELIENALDAGATRVEIHVDEDALGFLVRDNGCGMDEENLRLSVERHATSKIAALEDLNNIATRGFRGEALAALAAVARVEILSRPADSTGGRADGCRLRVSGGAKPTVSPTGAPIGTTVQVRDLFYNTPARLKFLKNPVAEWGHMLQASVRQALTRPDVAFSIRWKGKPYLDLPAGQTLAARLAEVLPGQAGEGMLNVDGGLHEVRVSGAVTHPNQTRRDRRHQYYFINGRPVVFRPLQFALEEAYRGLLMTQRYPMCAIMIEVPGEAVDVNVHPTKEEVRLRNDALVTGSVHRAVAEALRAADLVPTLKVAAPGAPHPKAEIRNSKFETQTPNSTTVDPPFSTSHSALRTPHLPPPEHRSTQLDFVPGFGLPRSPGPQASAPPSSTGEPYAEPAAREEATLIGRLRQSGATPRVLAQVGLTYIVAEAGGEGLLVVDQHAAHEKILYLDYMRQAARQGGIVVQPLLVPHSIELAPAEVSILEGLLPALAEAGFEVEPFGGRTFVVQAIPAALEKLDVPAFLRDLIDEIGDADVARELQRLRHKIGARAACRAAVKSGDRLTVEEMQRLLDQLMETEEALRCPHGRPTMLRLTREQMDGQFGRLG
jgi:DNA mismatch repair protein MutL